MSGKRKNLITALLCWVVLLSGCRWSVLQPAAQPAQVQQGLTLAGVPAFSGQAWVELENNVPAFSEEEQQTASFERYSDLDELGRCGPAYACLGPETMPTEPRGAIGQIRPSGWHLVKYDFVDGKYLYNRCHLIAYQLAGENDNEKNLITGTRYLNVVGMLPFENQVGGYIRKTGNHVLYRVTPVFREENLLSDGVEMEALSLEDGGEGVRFHVFVYNVQPGVRIDYSTGESREAQEDGQPAALQPVPEEPASAVQPESTYVLNLRSHKFHSPDCEGVSAMSPANKKLFTGGREELIAQGYQPCGRCRP